MQTKRFFGKTSCAVMSKMGVMPTVIERKSDPPPTTPQEAVSDRIYPKKNFPFSLEELFTLSIFICKSIVDDVYVNLNETSPMLL